MKYYIYVLVTVCLHNVLAIFLNIHLVSDAMEGGGYSYQHSDLDSVSKPNEIQIVPSLVDPPTPYDSINSISATDWAQQIESFEDIFNGFSNVDDLLPPPQPLPPPPQPLPFLSPSTNDQPMERLLKTNEHNSSRKRLSEAHNLTERETQLTGKPSKGLCSTYKRRRARIRERMNILQQLTPNCNKTSRVALLSDVIEYIKSLEKQVELLSLSKDHFAQRYIHSNPLMHPMGIPNTPPFMSAEGVGSMQVSCFPPTPIIPIAPLMGMEVNGSSSYQPTDIPVSPPFFFPSSTTCEFGDDQVDNQLQMPLLTSATTITAINSQLVAQTNLSQISDTVQGPVQGSVPIAGPSQTIKTSFGVNPCVWVPNYYCASPNNDQA